MCNSSYEGRLSVSDVISGGPEMDQESSRLSMRAVVVWWSFGDFTGCTYLRLCVCRVPFFLSYFIFETTTAPPHEIRGCVVVLVAVVQQ